MRQLQPVLWRKGTFLTPQHLQIQDRFLEDSMNFRVQALKFCAWGFNEVVIDQELLAEGKLGVGRASGIFPDGLPFEIPGPDQPPASKVLAEYFDSGINSLDFYLTVPDYKENGIVPMDDWIVCLLAKKKNMLDNKTPSVINSSPASWLNISTKNTSRTSSSNTLTISDGA